MCFRQHLGGTEQVQAIIIVNCLSLIALSAIPKMKHNAICDIDSEGWRLIYIGFRTSVKLTKP